MRCIICNDKMDVKKVDKINIDVCPNCEGVWLDEGELESLSGLDPGASRELKCTVCDIPMATKMINEVEIDYCQICNSVWLDKGELEKLSGVNPKTGRKNILYEYMNSNYFKKTQNKV